MKNGNNKNGIILLLIAIIVILVALVILFATDTIVFNHNDNDLINTQENDNDLNGEDVETVGSDVYSDFLSSKGYLQNFSESEHGAVSETSYAYYDLDNNGTLELIVYIADGYEFGTNLFYTYVENEVKFIDKIYHFGNLTYNQTDKSIVYTSTRPSTSYGWSYEFYVLNNNKFELVRTVGLKVEDNNETYFDGDEIITKDEYDNYSNNNISFDYNKLDD